MHREHASREIPYESHGPRGFLNVTGHDGHNSRRSRRGHNCRADLRKSEPTRMSFTRGSLPVTPPTCRDGTRCPTGECVTAGRNYNWEAEATRRGSLSGRGGSEARRRRRTDRVTRKGDCDDAAGLDEETGKAVPYQMLQGGEGTLPEFRSLENLVYGSYRTRSNENASFSISKPVITGCAATVFAPKRAGRLGCKEFTPCYRRSRLE